MEDTSMFDQNSVILDLEPHAAVLLGKAVEAGVAALATHLSLDEGEFLKGLAMFLGDTTGRQAETVHTPCCSRHAA
jgi:hypothetical protein